VLVAIETSTDVGSIAIGEGALLAGEVVIGVRTRHAESLLPALEFLLRSARLTRRDLTGIVVGAGPGSFTGVRVAAATARGLAHGLDVPLYAYSSLAGLAVQAGSAGAVCALLDARRGEVYAACYVVDQAVGGAATTLPRPLLDPVAVTVPDLIERLADAAPLFVGEGAERYAAALGAEPRVGLSPRASALLRLAAADGAGNGLVQDRAGWEPTYLRASGAERGIVG
jgi:tRNA threonylcarbamoyladenosine biosynthesis protein TsaB